MSYSLTNGLNDLSRELGESSVNITLPRIRHYGDAVVQFAKDRKWSFLCKENTTIPTTTSQSYDTSSITDMRRPGGIKEITIGDSSDPYLPVDYDQRNDSRIANRKRFYMKPDETTLVFVGDLTAGQTIHIWYYYIPARTEDTTAGTYPIPDDKRKIVATLAAAYVQWGRYLEAPGNRLYNLYTKMIDQEVTLDSERNSGNPRKLVHYLQRIGFRRSYR